jgi:dihydrofolate reductase
MSIAFVVAAAENGVIGNQGKLPWHLPDDLKRFKQLTLGHAVVMGRKTYEAIGRPLPGRDNYILTCNHLYESAHCKVLHSPLEVIELAQRSKEDVFVIGGDQVFALLLPAAQRIYLTRVHAPVEGDAFFKFDESQWQLLSTERHERDAQHAYAFSFLTYQRKGSAA